MCGLFGVIVQGPLHVELRGRIAKAVKLMGVMSSERGQDSAGIARITVEGAVALYKDVGSSERLVRRPPWRWVIDSAPESTFAFLGHTRRKTRGQINQANAHPFWLKRPTGHLIGTHNGTIHNHQQFGPISPFESDSRNLFHALADSDNWGTVLQEAWGTYAIAAAQNGQVLLARNSYTSPLYVQYDPLTHVTLYASTAGIVAAGAAVAGFGAPDPKELPTSVLYKFPARRAGDVDQIKLPDSDYGADYSIYATPNQWGTSHRGTTGRYHRAVCARCRATDDRSAMVAYGGSSIYCSQCYTQLQETYVHD